MRMKLLLISSAMVLTLAACKNADNENKTVQTTEITETVKDVVIDARKTKRDPVEFFKFDEMIVEMN